MSEEQLQTAEETVESSESAPGTEVNEEPTETPGEQAGAAEPGDPERFRKRINQKHFEAQEAKREAEALRRELENLRKQLPEEQRPVIPDQPDPYDADYQEKMKEYTDAVAAVAKFDQQQLDRQRFIERQQYEQNQQQLQETAKKVQTYVERAQKLGVSAEELETVGTMVGNYGLHQDLEQYILEDEQGPLITMYLGTNIEELEKVAGMTPTRAAVYLNGTIRDKATAQQGVSGAPEPPESLSGKGAIPTQRGPKGATFT